MKHLSIDDCTTSILSRATLLLYIHETISKWGDVYALYMYVSFVNERMKKGE